MVVFIIIICSLLVLLFSLRFTWWWLPRLGWVSLMYHHISDDKIDGKERAFYIKPDVFEKHVDKLLKNGYTTVLFEDIENAFLGNSSLPQKPVVITFDDGYLDNYTLLFPILKKKNVKANIFLVVNAIGVDKNYLNWQQVKEMQDSRLVSFGSHGMNHKRLRSLSDDEAFYELSESKKELEARLGKKVYSFAYPLGAGAKDGRIRPLVFKAGYLFDYSTIKGINSLPISNKKTVLRAFPRGGETMLDFYLQITRGRSKL